MAWTRKAVAITIALVVLLYVACEVSARPEYEASEREVAGRQKREDVTTEVPTSTASSEEGSDEECNGSGKGQGGKNGKGKGKCKGKGKAKGKGKNKKEEEGERRKRDLEDVSIFENDQELMDALFGAGNFN